MYDLLKTMVTSSHQFASLFWFFIARQTDDDTVNLVDINLDCC